MNKIRILNLLLTIVAIFLVHDAKIITSVDLKSSHMIFTRANKSFPQEKSDGESPLLRVVPRKYQNSSRKILQACRESKRFADVFGDLCDEKG